MLDFLSGRMQARLAQRKAQRAALVDQEAQQEAQRARLRSLVALLKELLRDQRYAAYAQLLSDAHASLLAARESTLRETQPDAALEVALLTGRIMQLEIILKTPEQLLALAEQGETNGNATPAARSPARESGLVAAKEGRNE